MNMHILFYFVCCSYTNVPTTMVVEQTHFNLIYLTVSVKSKLRVTNCR